jgi:sulfoxide reductase catalytic subunit YedY
MQKRAVRNATLFGAAAVLVGAAATVRWFSKKIPDRGAIADVRDFVSAPPPSVTEPRHDPLAEQLTHADDRVDESHWLPPQWGIAPEVRIGQRWYSTLSLLPIGFVGLLGAIAGAQGLRHSDWCKSFIERYPGIAQQAPSIDSGFPPWLRWAHFFNLFLMTFIMRSGVQILADHPRLYWNVGCTPGTEWFRFQRPVPQGRVWTAKDDSVTLPKWLGIPGLRHSIGLARWWHFSVNLLWVANGIVSYVNLFRTDQWKRLVPITWAVFPNALSTAIQYASLDFPPEKSWTRYNGLQQLTYFITVFVAAPTMVATGLMQSPAISNKSGILGRIVHRQAARSIHFLSFFWFLFFITAHITMVFVTGLRPNLNHMFAGKE